MGNHVGYQILINSFLRNLILIKTFLTPQMLYQYQTLDTVVVYIVYIYIDKLVGSRFGQMVRKLSRLKTIHYKE